MSADDFEAALKGARRTARRDLVVTSLMVIMFLAGIAMFVHGVRNTLSTDDQRELNYLNSTLHDLDEPTAANASVRRIECADADKKAERYLKVDAAGVRGKVARYLDGCKKEMP